ncbi:glutathione S-transferase family protein [Rhizobium sp. TRM95111]|uniref:glutathione S-transferase family protein n=1 Tax=Rhizobium alarense TaxID=2846851 RepID=UPI001F36E5EF|nr:glutathione S-transferase family protein [Rhizobium alarense]MCF3640983.1 glutathione S-transferase family protein [Rhizobium alarense]
MLTLVHAPLSRSFRMLWLLEELVADYDIRYVTIRRRDGSGGVDPDNPHPHGQVPALLHDGRLVTESVAVAQYLTDLFPRSEMGRPMGDPQRGDYLSWLAYYAGVIEPMQIAHMTGSTAGNPDLARLHAAMCERVITTLEAQPYVLGDRVSSVDIIVASSLMWMRDLLPPSAAIDAHVARMAARPALQRAQAKDRPEGQ